MPRELLASAREQAERSDPAVRAAALLHIARVQTAFDREEALRTFQQGLEEVWQLTGREREFLLEQARLLAAAAAPELLPQISAPSSRPSVEPNMLGQIMMQHGHRDAFLSYVMGIRDPSEFPFGMVLSLMTPDGDAATRLAVLRRTVEAWRSAPRSGMAQFIMVFQWHWRALPPEEARVVARDIVREVLDHPDSPMAATVQITSKREHHLFQIIHILQHLDPVLAESLIAGHPQLAAAVRRFPNGWESVLQEMFADRPAVPPAGGGFFISGSPRDFPYLRSLVQARGDGDFGPSMEYALQKYREDSAPDRPNAAPREFWPSTCDFRSILYRAGTRLGREAAAAYLDRIPHADLRMFAQIELAAALAGLPELQGVEREYRAAVRVDEPGTGTVVEDSTDRGNGGPRIRCPKCGWTPRAEDRWMCKCGHVWNTFDTGGVCPSCLYQWKITACLRCHEWSPHSEWYTQE